MKPQNIAQTIQSNVNINSEEYQKNKKDMLEKLSEIEDLMDFAELGGGMHHHERLASRGKMSIRSRIANFIDPDSPFLEISSLAAFGSAYPVGGGAVAGIGIVAGTECVIYGNDPTVLAGAMHTYSAKKWTRAMEISRVNKIPYIQFVESSGGDLRMGGGKGEGSKRGSILGAGHFAESGRTFYDVTELSKLRIPTISIVFGSSTAGGAYQPGMSDYNIFIKKQSKVFLGGPPLVKMATGEESDDETLGGGQMHAEVSGLADYLAEDEMDALRIGREVVSHLNWRKEGKKPKLAPDSPILDSEDLLGLVDSDLKKPFDVREVIGRIADGSRFEEFKPLFGPTIICGFASVHGYTVGIIGNNGPIFPDTASKGAHFVQLCNQIDIPIIFLQNITGFVVGKDYERDGQIKKGAQFLNSVSNSTVPHLTIILGASYGAGTYAMSGRAFDNAFTFLWPTAKIAVMGPKQIAGVMSIVRRARAARKGEKFDEKEDAAMVAFAEKWQEEGSLALRATGAISDDGIIDPRDTRTVLGICLSLVNGRNIEGAPGYGVYRL
ncbi:MAG: acetyl-CoA carboxylase carboxyltransferase subunit [Gammaproteobacteria bacterium]|jgi:acetyl-CoA carboxylase carboxyltransferase component|nr:acetyl-CoA carboxylase carboxyltransferase subunit [Gammaproteobacteria bacterium]|tara:strand:+ start:727 stop:2382 length:1656 start_codon:yes stop_codon:yes gene_type:complete